MRYGPMRRYVLAAEVVAADDEASVFGSRRRLRKDSRGLDATQLAVGSGGTLGVITGAVIDLVALPRSTQTWWLAVDDTSRVDRAARHARTPSSRCDQRLRAGVACRPGADAERSRSAAEPVRRGHPERRRARRVVARRRRRDGCRGRRRRRLHRRTADRRSPRRSGRRRGDSVIVSARACASLGVVLGHDVSVPRSALMAVRRRGHRSRGGPRPGRGDVRLRPCRRRRTPSQRAVPDRVRPAQRRAARGDPPGHRRPRRSPPAAATAPSTASARSTPSAGWPRRRPSSNASSPPSRTPSTRTASSATPPTRTTASDRAPSECFASPLFAPRRTRMHANTRMRQGSGVLGDEGAADLGETVAHLGWRDHLEVVGPPGEVLGDDPRRPGTDLDVDPVAVAVAGRVGDDRVVGPNCSRSGL